MDPRLTKAQQRVLCSQLGNVTLKLIYQASVHGYTAEAFHERCDDQGPTLSVGYNDSSFVFGGHTTISFNQSGQFGHDAQAFLFTFNRANVLKYPVTNPAYAVFMHPSHGPYFGDNLGFCVNGRAVVYNSPSQDYYNFNAAEMHGNDLKLVECEVYKIGDGSAESEPLEKPGSSKLLEKPWRNVVWTPENRERLLNEIQNYEPTGVGSLSQVRVLLIGPIAAGKSSLVNSIKSVFKGRVTNVARADNSSVGTTQYRTYQVNYQGEGKESKSLPFIVCDTMGLEGWEGIHVDDINSILRGHIKDRYQFNTAFALQPEDQDYKKNPSLKNRIHCVVYVIDIVKISIMISELQDKLTAIRSKVNLAGIPQLVLLTKVDEADPAVADDLTNVYRSLYIKTRLEEASQRLGVPLSCVVPVKNYSHQLEVDQNSDILLLSAVNQMLRFADDYFEGYINRSNDD